MNGESRNFGQCGKKQGKRSRDRKVCYKNNRWNDPAQLRFLLKKIFCNFKPIFLLPNVSCHSAPCIIFVPRYLSLAFILNIDGGNKTGDEIGGT